MKAPGATLGLFPGAPKNHMGYLDDYMSAAQRKVVTPNSDTIYGVCFADLAGDPLEGSKTYRLTVPANAPVEQYWSASAYDRETHALIRGMSRPSLASNDTLVQKNADGSVDVYLGPKPPAGKQTNWVPTDPTRRFELLFRLYGPKKELFDKTWKLPDVE